ncbi:MAG: hypothetical protein ACFFD5_10195 [Candidatus Thorarchaeota archaeon]
MRTRNIILIFVASIIVGGGLGFIITGFATYGTIENSFSFYYEGLPSPIEDLDLSADIANLDIQYNTSATPYLVEINVDLKISGLFAAGRKYTNFFAPSTEWWVNTTTPITFDMKAKPGAWFDPSHWFSSYNVEVTVILRSDVIFNLDAATGTGSIELDSRDNITLNGVSCISGTGSLNVDFSNNTKIQSDLYLKTGTGNIAAYGDGTNFTQGIVVDAGTGNIILNFTNCVMLNDIYGETGTGNIDLKTYNMEYSINSDLTLETGTGKITLLINQDAGMGANVTGLLKTGTGNIVVTYLDSSSLVGASFFGDTGTGNFNRINSGGFVDPSYNPFDSIDFFTSSYNYDFSLETGTGNITVDGSSS